MMREKTKWRIFRILNILIPLLLGSAIYISMTDDTFISRWVRSAVAWEVDAVIRPDPGILRLLRNYLCDICWAYSMVFCVAWILGDGSVSLAVAVSICVLFSSLMEFLQLCAAIPGTFDVWDILLEIVSCLIAGMVIYTKIWRKRK